MLVLIFLGQFKGERFPQTLLADIDKNAKSKRLQEQKVSDLIFIKVYEVEL